MTPDGTAGSEPNLSHKSIHPHNCSDTVVGMIFVKNRDPGGFGSFVSRGKRREPEYQNPLTPVSAFKQIFAVDFVVKHKRVLGHKTA